MACSKHNVYTINLSIMSNIVTIKATIEKECMKNTEKKTTTYITEAPVRTRERLVKCLLNNPIHSHGIT